MLKKEEVYVFIEKQKHYDKFNKIVNMFNVGYTLDFHGVGGIAVFDNCFLTDTKNKTEVSLKELRNILAREYLKEGDVVVCRNKKTSVEHIFEIDSISLDCFGYLSRHSNKDGFSINNGYWSIPSFIRYATEEEKQLLKPQESVIDKAISLLKHGLGLDYSHDVVQGLEELKNK